MFSPPNSYVLQELSYSNFPQLGVRGRVRVRVRVRVYAFLSVFPR